ncbi:MAG: hypothetical protein MPK31_09320, partial [Gammaproteobacteria bacterium]|nr:hypothetical protein [Gammaproteobacteria bacterium]
MYSGNRRRAGRPILRFGFLPSRSHAQRQQYGAKDIAPDSVKDTLLLRHGFLRKNCAAFYDPAVAASSGKAKIAGIFSAGSLDTAA